MNNHSTGLEERPDFFPTLLKEWQVRVRSNQIRHYAAAERLSKLNYWLGIPAVVLSGVVGTSVFASIDREAGTFAKLFVGLVSLGVGVLAALQTFLRFAERAEQHRNTAVGFGAIHRKIELLLALPAPSMAEARRILTDLEEKMSAIDQQAPVLVRGREFTQIDTLHLTALKD